MRARGIIIAVVTAFALGACEDVLGLGDLSARPDASLGSDGASDDDSAMTTDTNNDVNAGTEAGVDGCNGGVEDCQNGVDDDCNLLEDCADPVCQGAGYQCAGVIPPGWLGIAALATVSGETTPACSSGDYINPIMTGHTGMNAPPITCGCSCSNPPINVTCGGLQVQYFSDACSTQIGSAGVPLSFCVSSGGGNHVQAVADTTSYNGDCTATPTKSVPPVTHSNSYALCGFKGFFDSAGCKVLELCVAHTIAGFVGPCVYQTGDVTCPAGKYTSKTMFYVGESDTRDCSTCGCSASAGTCTGTMDVYAANGCTGTKTSLSTDGGCVAFSAIGAKTTSVDVNVGTCGANGGVPIGSADAGSPVTVCCQP